MRLGKEFYVGISFVCLLSFELFFGSWISGSDINTLQLDRNVRYAVTLLSTDGKPRRVVHLNKDQYGLRGQYGAPDEIDILVLGDSNTEQRSLDEKDSWTAVMADCLSHNLKRKINVANAGLSGFSSYGLLDAMDVWLAQIPKLRARYIVVYTGVNELSGTTLKIKRNTDPFRRFFKKSGFYYWYAKVRAVVESSRSNISFRDEAFSISSLNTRLLKDVTLGPPVSEKVLSTKTRIGFRENLVKLDQKIKGMGGVPIFISERDMSYRIRGNVIDALIEEDGANTSGFEYYKAWRILEKIMGDVCKYQKSLCVNLASEANFEIEDFSDRVHVNSKGSRKIGDFLCRKLEHFPLLNAKVGENISG